MLLYKAYETQREDSSPITTSTEKGTLSQNPFLSHRSIYSTSWLDVSSAIASQVVLEAWPCTEIVLCARDHIAARVSYNIRAPCWLFEVNSEGHGWDQVIKWGHGVRQQSDSALLAAVLYWLPTPEHSCSLQLCWNWAHPSSVTDIISIQEYNKHSRCQFFKSLTITKSRRW